MDTIQSVTDRKRTKGVAGGRIKKRTVFFLGYTIAFLAVYAVIFSIFRRNDAVVIWLGDGRNQHVVMLKYFAQYCKEVIRSLLRGSFNLPEFDFSIGFGAPVYTSILWQLMADPLYYLSVLFDGKNYETVIHVLAAVRLYLSGLLFAVFCFVRNKEAKYEAVLIGALSYAFCGYAVFTFARHPVFINPMLVFPLVLAAAELMIRKDRRALFSLAVGFCLINSFYFGYMIGIFTVFYILGRYFSFYENLSINDFLKYIGRFFLQGCLGVALAGVCLVPVFMIYRTGMRTTVDIAVQTFYDLNYYRAFCVNFLGYRSPGSWTHIGAAGISLLGFFAVLTKKTGNDWTGREKRELWLIRAACIGTLLMLLIPVFGSVLNGFNYVSNRWEWAFSFVFSYLIVYLWNDYWHLSVLSKCVMALFLALYIGALCAYRGGQQLSMMKNALWCSVITAGVFVILTVQQGIKKHRQAVYGTAIVSITLLTVLQAGVNSYFLFDTSEGDYISEFRKTGAVQNTFDNSVIHAMELYEEDTEDAFGRYEAAQYGLKNWDALTGGYGTQFFWSLANGNTSQLLYDMGMNSWVSYNHAGLAGRTFLDELQSVKYFTARKKHLKLYSVPYGYHTRTKVKAGGTRYYVLENEYALPLGYTYDKQIRAADYEALDAAGRQEALLQGVLIGDEDGTYTETIRPVTTAVDIPYELSASEHLLRLADYTYMAGSNSESLTFTFDGMENCETYLVVDFADADFMTDYELYTDDIEEIYPRAEFEAKDETEKERLAKSHEEWGEYREKETEYEFAVSSEEQQRRIVYRKPYNTYYLGQKEFLVNFGYREDKRKEVTLYFPKQGIYHFDSLRILCQPMDAYPGYVQNLRSCILENTVISTDKVTGNIRLEKPKVLVLSIPYDGGWSAYVDGKKTKVMRANIMHCALALDSGEHTVELIYHMPGLRAGAAISLAAVLCLIVGSALEGRRRRRPDTLR